MALAKKMNLSKPLLIPIALTIFSSCSEDSAKTTIATESKQKKIVHPTEFINTFSFAELFSNIEGAKWRTGSISQEGVISSGKRKSCLEGVISVKYIDISDRPSISDIRSDLLLVFANAPNIKWDTRGVVRGRNSGVYNSELSRGEIEFKIVLGAESKEYFIYYRIEETPLS